MKTDNFITTKDAGVYVPISKDTAKILVENKTKESYELWELHDNEAYVLSDIDTADTIGIYVGQLSEMIDGRKILFPTLESIAEYYAENGSMPWGLRAIAQSNGWERHNMRGYKLCLRDVVRNKGLWFDGKTKNIVIDEWPEI